MVSFHRLIPACDVLGTTYCVTEVVEFGILPPTRFCTSAKRTGLDLANLWFCLSMKWTTYGNC